VWWVAGILRAAILWLSSPWAFSSKRRQTAALELELLRAQTYKEWLVTANAIDRMSGNDGWRRSVESPDYDSRLVTSMLGQIRAARKGEQTQELMFLLGSALHRRFGSIDRSVLCESARQADFLPLARENLEFRLQAPVDARTFAMCCVTTFTRSQIIVPELGPKFWSSGSSTNV
jgi:hypothetical protein